MAKPGTKEYHRERASKYYYENRQKVLRRAREWSYTRNYGLSFADVEVMLKKQKQRCAICKILFKQCGLKKKARVDFRVDHNHDTGKTRALLCQRCNTFVGYIETNGHLIDPIQSYLEAA